MTLRSRLCLILVILFAFNIEAKPIRLAISSTIDYSYTHLAITQTISQLKLCLGSDNLEVVRLSDCDLSQSIEDGKVDVFLASGAFYRQQIRLGARDLATLQFNNALDPNHQTGTLVLVRDDRTDLKYFLDLKGKRIGYSPAFGFSGLIPVLGELRKKTTHVESFFSQLLAFKPDVSSMLLELSSGKVDAVALPSCLLEWEAMRKDINTVDFRVLEPRHFSTFRCFHSTELFPGLTFASLPTLSARKTREFMQAILTMDNRHNELIWGIASNFHTLDSLLKDLNLDAWAKDRQWTFRKVLADYAWAFALLISLILILIAHNLRTAYLVRKRTKELSDSLIVQTRLRDQAKSANKRIEKLQQIATMEQMSTIFSHELRQPLNAIECYSFSLQRLMQRHAYDSETFSQALGKILEMSKFANSIIQKVCSYVKKQTAQKELIDLVLVVQDGIREFSLLDSDNCDIVFNDKTPAIVHVNPMELQLVVINLLRNSKQALHGHRKPSIFLSLKQEGNYAKLSAWDNADYIENDVLYSLQHNEASSTTNEGLGLGLSIVRTIVELHNGILRFDRSSLGGLQVDVLIPTAELLDETK